VNRETGTSEGEAGKLILKIVKKTMRPEISVIRDAWVHAVNPERIILLI
jgi:hypothetical protein